MKLRYLIISLLLCFAVGCAQEELNTLSEIQLPQSYVALDVNGGTESLSFTATENWQIVESSVPDWLLISPMSGPAGEATIAFSANATKATNNAEIQISCGGKTQYINVIQFAAKADPVVITVKDAINLIKSGTQGEGEYYVKGIVCKIDEIDTGSYGNATYYLSDDGTFGDGNWLEVYRGYWIGGVHFATGDEFAVGDELTIVAVLIDYKGTPETNQYTASVVSINKSLIKVDETPEDVIPIEGGAFDIKLTCKGDGISVNIPDEAQSWLSVVGITTSGSTATVTFNAAPNAGGDRTADLAFVTTSAGKSYTAQTSISQKGSILEVSVADFNAAPVGDTQYRVTGVVSSIAKAEFGNIYIRDWSGETYIYGIGAKGDFEKTGIKVGDIITVVGKRGVYNTTIEMLNTVIENVISVNEVDFPTFIAAEKSKDVYYRLTGTITNIEKADYGNLYIKDEAGNEVYVYGVYPGYGAQGDNRKNFLATAGIEVGDVLTVEGYKDVYNGKIELCGGIYISHEKGSDQPDQPAEPSTYSIDLGYSLGSSAWDDGAATVNGEEVAKTVKIGTSSKTGEFTLKVPAGTKKITYYAVAWKGLDTTVEFYDGEALVASQAVAANDGALGTGPYTISVTDSDKYVIEKEFASATDLRVTTAEGANFRAIFFGIKAE